MTREEEGLSVKADRLYLLEVVLSLEVSARLGRGLAGVSGRGQESWGGSLGVRGRARSSE